MSRWLIGGCAAAVVMAVASLFMAESADKRADVAEGKVLVLDSLRQVADAKSRQDSLELVAAQAGHRTDSVRIDSLRAKLRQDGQRAALVVRAATDSLRSLIAGQGEAERALDAIEVGYRAELAAKDAEIAAADSATAAERSLRVATERALASERLAHQADLPQIVALQDQVRALKSARKWDGIKKILEGAGAGFAAGAILAR